MNTFRVERPPVLALSVQTSDEILSVNLADGRTLSVPIDWYPRLAHGSPDERNNWQLIGRGIGIHWPDLDEDISVEGLLGGFRSGEGARSFTQWLESRKSAR